MSREEIKIDEILKRNIRHNTSGFASSGLGVVFILFLVFLGAIPFSYGNLDRAGNHIFLLVCSGLLILPIAFSIYWLRLFDLTANLTGEKITIYKKIDLIQFKNMSYFNFGIKTREEFLKGYFNNKTISFVLSDRYDSSMLGFCICGIVLLIMGIGAENISDGTRFSRIANYEVARSIITSFGGYIFVWAFSLYLFGLRCTFHKSGEKS